jgi:hypothetical protein
MFEVAVDVSDEGLRSCADGLVASVPEMRLVAAQRMARVVHWADLHAPAPGKAGFTPGGDGTPEVTPFAATELGCLLQTTTMSARSLLADALDLRHRHPRLWGAVMTGQVEDFKARHVARLARGAGLSLEQAHRVDVDVVEAVVGLPWGRAMTVVEAAIIRADPGGHERRRAEAASQRYVAQGKRDTTVGLGTLITRTGLGDIARLDAMATRLADVLAAQGDEDDLQVRRAKAMAILADPAHACLLLAEHDSRTESVTGGARTDAAESIERTLDPASELGRLLRKQGATALAKLRPRTVIHVHISADALQTKAGVARVEGLGPVGLSDLHELLGRDALVIKPVIDHRGQVPVDAYEVPAAMRESMVMRHPFEVFPWGTLTCRKAEQDHTIPYRPPDEGGPPGQTWPGNLGPLSRGHHNAKTHGGFALYQPQPGVYLWRTPTGFWYQVDAAGTTDLGRGLPAPMRHRPVDVRHSQVEMHMAGLLAA